MVALHDEILLATHASSEHFGPLAAGPDQFIASRPDRTFARVDATSMRRAPASFFSIPQDLALREKRHGDDSSNDDLPIIPISDDADRHFESLSAAGELHRTLRPNLPEDYQAYIRRMFAEGAEMVDATVNGVAKSLAVYRCRHTTFHGLRFYVDDLVTVERTEKKGMVAFCRLGAKSAPANGVRLLRPSIGRVEAQNAPILFSRGPHDFCVQFHEGSALTMRGANTMRLRCRSFDPYQNRANLKARKAGS